VKSVDAFNATTQLPEIAMQDMPVADADQPIGVQLANDHVLIGKAGGIPAPAPTPVVSVGPVVLPAPGRLVDLQLRVSAPATGRDLRTCVQELQG
jgi:hypothetical protein